MGGGSETVMCKGRMHILRGLAFGSHGLEITVPPNPSAYDLPGTRYLPCLCGTVAMPYTVAVRDEW